MDHLIWRVECHSVSTLTHLNTNLNTQLHSKLLSTLSYLSLYNHFLATTHMRFQSEASF